MLKIEITAMPSNDGQPASTTIENALAAIGFVRSVPSIASIDAVAVGSGGPAARTEHGELLKADALARQEGKNLDGSERRETVEKTEEAPKPRRGRPPKEVDANQQQAADKGIAAAPQIQTQPEDRRDPAAEADIFGGAPAKTSDAPKKLTHDDVRHAAGRFVDKFGPAAAVKIDAASLCGFAGGTVSVPDDQESLAKVIAKWNELADADTLPQGFALTLDDVKAAMGEYVKKFGKDAAGVDGIPCMCGHANVSSIPDDQAELGKVVAAWKKMTAENPHNRAVVSK